MEHSPYQLVITEFLNHQQYQQLLINLGYKTHLLASCHLLKWLGKGMFSGFHCPTTNAKD